MTFDRESGAYEALRKDLRKFIPLPRPPGGAAVTSTGAVSSVAASEVTIASGVVTVTGTFHTVDTESDAASDDLDTISGGTTGQTLTLRSADDARDPTLKDATGNLQLAGDFTLGDTNDTITLIYDGSNWLETGRSTNG